MPLNSSKSALAPALRSAVSGETLRGMSIFANGLPTMRWSTNSPRLTCSPAVSIRTTFESMVSRPNGCVRWQILRLPGSLPPAHAAVGFDPVFAVCPVSTGRIGLR